MAPFQKLPLLHPFTCKEIVYYQLEQTGALLKCLSKAVLKLRGLHEEILATDVKKSILATCLHTHITRAERQQGNIPCSGSVSSVGTEACNSLAQRSCSTGSSGISATAQQNTTSEEKRGIRKQSFLYEPLILELWKSAQSC